MVRRGLAATRSEAKDAIAGGRVIVRGALASKSGSLVATDDSISVAGDARHYASRGGDKLAPALETLGVRPAGRFCLDAGAGSGGFTDVLLEGGAGHVVAIDVGYGQFAWRLRTDPRVTLIERYNVRNLRREDLPYSPDLVVADLSFISLTKVLPALTEASALRAEFVLLVKPQFEADRDDIGGGGVVRNPLVWARAIERVAIASAEVGIGPIDVVLSSLRGPSGNVEFFLHGRKETPARPLRVGEVIAEASRVAEEAR
jgi:23S rRNA (cytidine1920-2'-O)/16S rRNA (cytidine1409-2'-O)-methyltransferase